MRKNEPEAMIRRTFEFHIFVSNVPEDADTKEVIFEDNVSYWGHSFRNAENRVTRSGFDLGLCRVVMVLCFLGSS